MREPYSPGELAETLNTIIARDARDADRPGAPWLDPEAAIRRGYTVINSAEASPEEIVARILDRISR